MFADKFKDICEEIKRQTTSLPKTRRVTYTLFKRSLPIEINQPIMFGLTKEDVEKRLKGYLKAKVIESDGVSKVIYYDWEEVCS